MAPDWRLSATYCLSLLTSNIWMDRNRFQSSYSFAHLLQVLLKSTINSDGNLTYMVFHSLHHYLIKWPQHRVIMMFQYKNTKRLNTDPERVGFVWCILCGRRCFWGGTVGRGRGAPSPGPWHTGQRQPGTPAAAAVWREPGVISEQRFDEPGSTHPAGKNKRVMKMFSFNHIVNYKSGMWHVKVSSYYTMTLRQWASMKNTGTMNFKQRSRIQPLLNLIIYSCDTKSLVKTKKQWYKGETDVDNEATELELLRCDDVMVTRLLSQLHNGSTCGQPQARHVRLTARKERGEKMRKMKR